MKLLEYLNPAGAGIELETEPQKQEVTLRTNQAIRLIADPGGSEECVLRYLQIRSLVLQNTGDIDLYQLNGLTIQQLDLRGCVDFKLEKPLALPALEMIIIDPQFHAAEQLKTWVRSSVNFEIVEAP